MATAKNLARECAQKAVAQSTSIAVQDAADNLRNLSTISTTAIGVAMAKFIATGDPKYVAVIAEAERVATNAVEHFGQVGETAAKILDDFSP